MPSAYCVVYAKAGLRTYVLVATKAHGVPNNPDQVVFPGGRIACTGRFPNETVAQAAVREFHEETGIAMTATQIALTTPIAIISTESWRFNYSYTNRYNQTVNDFYGGFYVQVASQADLVTLADAINTNIRNHAVTDAELVSSAVMEVGLATSTFATEDVVADPRRRTEWFVEISQAQPLQIELQDM